MDKYRYCDEVWRIAGIGSPTVALGASSSYLVALIVLLRLLMIQQPMNYGTAHKTVSRFGYILSWVLSLLVPSVKFIVSFPSLYDVNIYNTFVAIETYGLMTAPIILTILLYAVLLCFLNQQVALSDAVISRMKALAKMTHGVVAGLIVCNVPGLLIMAYLSSRLGQGRSEDLFASNTVV